MTTNQTTTDSGPAPEPRLLFRRVQKRDGTLVAFDRNKIADAIYKAMQATSTGDRALAEEMADRVIIHLARTHDDHLLNIEDIQDAVENVLMENGQSRVAKAYILYRNEHARRRSLRIQTGGRSRPPRDLVSTEVESTRGELVTWNRERIVQALIRETGLAREAANRISAEVEEQLIYSRATTLTTDLIRELVNAKLVEHGYTHERVLHARLGVPLYDVERALTAGPFPPESTDLALAGTILREYAVRRIFPQDAVDAHLRGEIILNDLDRITRPGRLVLSPAYLLKFGLRLPHALAHARPARHAETLLAHVVKASTALQNALCAGTGWDALDVIFGPLVDQANDAEIEQLAQTVVFDFSQQSEAQGGRPLSVDLHIYCTPPPRLRSTIALGPGGAPLTRPYGAYANAIRRFATALVRAFRQGDGRGHPFVCPRLVVHVTDDLLDNPDDQPFLEEALELAAMWGTPIFQFDRGPMIRLADFAPPLGPRPRYPWQYRAAAAGDVTINLGHAALGTGGNEQQLREMVMDMCRLAVKALLSRRAFLGRLLAHGENGPLAMLCTCPDGDPLFLLSQATSTVSLLGLGEMLTRLHPTAAGTETFAQTLLAMLARDCETYSAMHGVPFTLGASTDTRLAQEAARNDTRQFALHETPPQYAAPFAALGTSEQPDTLSRLRAEATLARHLTSGAFCLLRESELPTQSLDRLRLLQRVHTETSCPLLAVAVDVTLCHSCGAVHRGRSEICPECASARVLGLSRLVGPLEVFPRWQMGF